MENHIMLLAKKLIQQNPRLILGGSLALQLHGFALRREPTDIDFNSLASDDIRLSANGVGITYNRNDHDFDSDSPTGGADVKEKVVVKYAGEHGIIDVKVDLFQWEQLPFVPEKIGGMRVAPAWFILAEKLRYVVIGTDKNNKYKNDLLFTLANIDGCIQNPKPVESKDQCNTPKPVAAKRG